MGAVIQNVKAGVKIKARSKNYLIYLMVFMGLVAIMDQYLSTVKTTAIPYILEEYAIDASRFSYLEAVYLAFTFLIFLLNGLTDIIGRKYSILVLVVGLIGLFAPVGLGEPADPMNTPAHVKPEWYFLGLYQLLKYISKTAGAVLPILAVLLITLWPFIDRKPDKSTKAYWWRAIGVGIFMIILIAMTIWGEVS